MLKQFHRLIFSAGIALTIVVLAACAKNDFAAKEQAEKDLIAEYTKEHNITEDQKQQSGIYYIEERAGTGLSPVKHAAPKENDYVIINYTGRYLSDNSIHETTYKSLKSEWKNSVYYTDYVYGPLRFLYGYSISGINEGLALMKEGGKAQILIPSDMAFYDYNPMIYEIELLKVVSDAPKYDSTVMTNYLLQQAWDTASTKVQGTYWVKKEVYLKETFTPDPNDLHTFGSATHDTLYLNFKGKLLDGYNPTVTERVFDSITDPTKPLKFYKGGSSPLPKGLLSAFDTLRMGTHATFVLPWQKAYGDQGKVNGTYGYTIVPPYQSLVYEIEVVDYKFGTVAKKK